MSGGFRRFEKILPLAQPSENRILTLSAKNINLVNQSNPIMARKETIRAFHRISERKVLVKDRNAFFEDMDRLFEELDEELPAKSFW